MSGFFSLVMFFPGASVLHLVSELRFILWLSDTPSYPSTTFDLSVHQGWIYLLCFYYSVIQSVQFCRSVISDSLRPHGLQHARPPCPSPTPGVKPGMLQSMGSQRVEHG